MIEPLVLRHRPWPRYLSGAVVLTLGLAGLVAPVPWPLRFVLLGVFGVFGALAAWQGVRQAATLTVADGVRWVGHGVTAEVRRDQVRAVAIVRPNLLGRATRYVVVATLNGRRVRLLFAEHWASGRGAMASAQAVADRLGVPIEDPTGALWRASWFPPARWLGRGEEWKVWILSAILAACIGGVGLALAW